MSQPPSSTGTPAPIANGSTPAAPAKHSANEIGWQFINQYYKFLHGSVEKLHRFYTKKSTFSHGTEGDEPTPCFGQQDIHNKIMSLGIVNPKAFLHSIHSQSSQSGGIVIQVIGEMQNGNSEDAPWRKFTQTFFLAEQPNGYYVLNDIFMYLKEEGEFEEEAPEEEEIVMPAAPEEAVHVEEAGKGKELSDAIDEKDEKTSGGAVTPEVQTVGEVETSDNKEEETPTKAEEVVEEPIAEEEKQEPVEEKAETTPEPPISEPAEIPAETPAPVEPVVEEKKEETPAPVKETPAPSPNPAAAPAPQQQQPAAAKPAPPKPTGPPPPKTWASTAAAAKGAWGTALATKEAAAASGSANSTPSVIQPQRQQRPAPPAQTASTQGAQASGASTPAQAPAAPSASGPQAGAPAGKFPQLDAARSINTHICFVKLNNWQQTDTTPPVTEAALASTMGKYGEITKIDFVKSKACAFVEYKSIESARKAIIASLRTQDGGEGGIRIPMEGGGSQKIIVESRKEKEDRGKLGQVGAGAPQQQGQGQGQQGPRRQGSQQGGQQQGSQGQGQGRGQGQRGGRGGARGGQQGQNRQ